MKLRLRDVLVPYPLFTLRGRLKLCGLSDRVISNVLEESVVKEMDTEEALLNHVRESLKTYDPSILSCFDSLTRYETIRGDTPNTPALLIALEGASATGKSLIALELMHNLAATRFISTDTVRQVLRSILREEEHPELFCHTYQAHRFRTIGPHDLDPVVRGYLAQCELISPSIRAMVERVVSEGAITVIEGVHIQPGTLQDISPSVIEVLINPDRETHRAMFASKHNIGKLQTVSEDIAVRYREFEATCAIQEYLIHEAERAGVPIVPMIGYNDALREIASLIISRVEALLSSHEDGGVK
jgi:2-phosphoglycerate kinase